MQDGYTQSGAGPSDMRVGGEDLQHYRQKLSGNRAAHSTPVSQMDVHKALMQEVDAHKEGRKMRLDDLKRHYER
jgi:hypothetical protein